MENQRLDRELKAVAKGETEYKIYEVYENTTLTEAYAMALEDIKKYPEINDWYLNF